jgi:restriction system protein
MPQPDATIANLDEWLDVVLGAKPIPKHYTTYQFPTQAHYEQFIARLATISEAQVLSLLRLFLLPSMSLGADEAHFKYLMHLRSTDQTSYERVMRLTFNQRLVRYVATWRSPPPWEGITWVLDLLPDWPADALKALDSYFLAHAQFLPDGRLHGLSDAMALIRAWYIGSPATQEERLQLLRALLPRDFERVVHAMYTHMGYDAALTRASKDGGRDIIASRNNPGGRESIRIECKRWYAPVGVRRVRELLGVVSSEKVNKGVLVTTGRFTRGALAFAAQNTRLELLSGSALIPLLNEHLGASWPTRLDSVLLESKQSTRESAA